MAPCKASKIFSATVWGCPAQRLGGMAPTSLGHANSILFWMAPCKASKIFSATVWGGLAQRLGAWLPGVMLGYIPVQCNTGTHRCVPMPVLGARACTRPGTGTCPGAGPPPHCQKMSVWGVPQIQWAKCWPFFVQQRPLPRSVALGGRAIGPTLCTTLGSQRLVIIDIGVAKGRTLAYVFFWQ